MAIRFPPYRAFFLTLIALVPVHLLIPGIRLVPFPYTLIGLVLIGAGGWLATGQQSAMAAHAQAGMYESTPTRLITSGVFRLSRNPLYLAMVLLTLGIAILLGSAGALAVVVVEFVLMNVWGIPPEERRLREALGAEYDAYARRVRRWL